MRGSAMIASMPSDADVEDWFFSHRDEVQFASEYTFLPIAPWLPIIGIPANDL